MRVIAVDYGDVRTGIAISDSSRIIAGDTLVIKESNLNKLVSRICGIAENKGADTIVVGLPLNMDGTRGIRAEKSEALAVRLRMESGLQIVLIDERRTSTDAHRILFESGNNGKKQKKKVDAVAAALILETYLNKTI